MSELNTEDWKSKAISKYHDLKIISSAKAAHAREASQFISEVSSALSDARLDLDSLNQRNFYVNQTAHQVSMSSAGKAGADSVFAEHQKRLAAATAKIRSFENSLVEAQNRSSMLNSEFQIAAGLTEQAKKAMIALGLKGEL